MRDPVLSRACVRSLEIISEAVKNVSQELRAHREITGSSLFRVGRG